MPKVSDMFFLFFTQNRINSVVLSHLELFVFVCVFKKLLTVVEAKNNRAI